jgi:enoyl-CoA hydratase/carnithine racemase
MTESKSMVAVEFADSAAIVRLNRPEKLNAFTFEMIEAIRAAVDRAAADPRATAIVITGTGRAFSAGLDTGDLAKSAASGSSTPEGSTNPHPEDLPALFSYLLAVPKPVIAAVNGVAAGGGFVLAMMCDIRFAAHEATFTTAFSKRGLIAEHGTSWILPRLVGINRALDVMWSARRFDATEAYRIGFIDRLVDGSRLLDEVRAYVRDLDANVSPRSLAVMKAQIYRGMSMTLKAALLDADDEMNHALKHPDATEGVASFVERRPARFKRMGGNVS